MWYNLTSWHEVISDYISSKNVNKMDNNVFILVFGNGYRDCCNVCYKIRRSGKPSVRFQILTAASVKFRAVWDVAPCSHVEVDRRFRGVYCLHHQGSE
jgi:ribosomal protein S12